ncbi:hypothetical protein D3C77_625990 [compost metagenome]
MGRVQDEDLYTTVVQVIRQGLVIDPGRLEEHFQLPNRLSGLGATPVDQGGKATRLVSEYLGFDLQTLRVSQPQTVQLLLTDVDTDYGHLSILALFMQPHSRGGAWIPFRIRRKRAGGTIYNAESNSQVGAVLTRLRARR